MASLSGMAKTGFPAGWSKARPGRAVSLAAHLDAGELPVTLVLRRRRRRKREARERTLGLIQHLLALAPRRVGGGRRRRRRRRRTTALVADLKPGPPLLQALRTVLAAAALAGIRVRGPRRAGCGVLHRGGWEGGRLGGAGRCCWRRGLGRAAAVTLAEEEVLERAHLVRVAGRGGDEKVGSW